MLDNNSCAAAADLLQATAGPGPPALPSLPTARLAGKAAVLPVPETPRELACALRALCSLIATRVREFQSLTGWPLLGRRRSPAELARLLDAAEEAGSEGAAWQALGMAGSPFVNVPVMPDWARKDLWGPLDLLLALAGHLSTEPDETNGVRTKPPASGGPWTITLQNHVPKARKEAAVTAPGASNQANRPGAAPSKAPPSPFSYPSLLKNQGGANAAAFGAMGGSLPNSLAVVTSLAVARAACPATPDWLRAFFSDFRPQHRHVGLDDRLHPWFRELKLQAASALLEQPSAALCRGFAKFGVPHGMRPDVWRVALGLNPGPPPPAAAAHFGALVHEACCQPLLADSWVVGDCELVRDSEQFFLFAEIIRAVMLASLRDSQLAAACAVPPLPCLLLGLSTGQPQQGGRPAGGPTGPLPYPPSGILAPHGTSLLVGPLCFLCDDPAGVYALHTAMYKRYWCRLCSLDSQGPPSPTLPSLVRTYELLLQELDPHLVAHLCSLGVTPGAVALPWIVRAFAGYLPVEEVLLLWDRIIGLDSLLPVALLAVAVMCFRRQVLMSCSAAREVLDAMSDLSQLQAVPLLQAVLFHA